jgi:CDGSH-type Zn-finger protein
MATTIKLIPAGPAVIADTEEQGCVVTKEDGTIVEIPNGEHMALCRCTKSKKFPFCDGSHKH